MTKTTQFHVTFILSSMQSDEVVNQRIIEHVTNGMSFDFFTSLRNRYNVDPSEVDTKISVSPFKHLRLTYAEVASNKLEKLFAQNNEIVCLISTETLFSWYRLIPLNDYFTIYHCELNEGERLHYLQKRSRGIF